MRITVNRHAVRGRQSKAGSGEFAGGIENGRDSKGFSLLSSVRSYGPRPATR